MTTCAAGRRRRLRRQCCSELAASALEVPNAKAKIRRWTWPSQRGSAPSHHAPRTAAAPADRARQPSSGPSWGESACRVSDAVYEADMPRRSMRGAGSCDRARARESRASPLVAARAAMAWTRAARAALAGRVALVNGGTERRERLRVEGAILLSPPSGAASGDREHSARLSQSANKPRVASLSTAADP